MSTKLSSLVLAAILLTIVRPAEAQQAKLAKIGWLGTRPDSSQASTGSEVIRSMLREFGYVEGKNMAVEYRSADNKFDQLPGLADELVRLKVDVLVTPSPPAAIAAKNATRTIPIVFNSVSDPIALGLVDSLARPGRNITGVTNIASDLMGKRMEILKETVPKLSRVAVLWNPHTATSPDPWKESQLVAKELGLQVHSMEVSSTDRYEGAFKEVIKAGSTALAVTLSPLANANQKRIADLAIKHRLPAIYPRADYAASGGLISYGADQAEAYRRVASMVDKILKGTKPADIPVEQPRKFELVINLKTANALDLTIPPNVLARANKVIR
jgi:putative ABC transport system substrate-binding protein